MSLLSAGVYLVELWEPGGMVAVVGCFTSKKRAQAFLRTLPLSKGPVELWKYSVAEWRVDTHMTKDKIATTRRQARALNTRPTTRNEWEDGNTISYQPPTNEEKKITTKI